MSDAKLTMEEKGKKTNATILTLVPCQQNREDNLQGPNTGSARANRPSNSQLPRKAMTIGDKTITYLTFIPDELF